MKHSCALISLLLCFSFSFAEEMGTWKSFFSYNDVEHVIQSKDKVYALGNGVLFSVDKEFESIETLTKVNGLSDCYINQVAYNSLLDALIITYDNSNIDILGNQGIVNIPDFKRKEINSKQINSITFYKEYAYLACGLGIVAVDMQKEEIADTYIIGEKGDYVSVNKVEIINDSIYALTPKGIRRAPMKNSNLADYSQWEDVEYLSSVPTTITAFNNQLVLVGSDSIYKVDKGITTAFMGIQKFTSISPNGQNLTIADNDTVYNFDASYALKESFFVDYVRDVIYTPASKSYWMAKAKTFADFTNGKFNLFKYKDGMFANRFIPNGPRSHSIAFVKYQFGKLVTGSGGPFDIPGMDNYGILQIYEDGKWTNIEESDFEPGVSINIGSRFVDILDAAVDPSDPKRIYVASWRSLFEIYDKKPVKQYWTDNSALAGSTMSVLVDGLCFDKDNNLWMTNMITTNGLVVKKNDGTWESLYYSDLDNIGTIKETFISSNDYIWVLRPRLSVGTGVLVINPNGTPFERRDDQVKYYSSFMDNDGNSVSPNSFRCIAEDKNNAIWIGTSVGPLIVNRQEDIFNKNFTINRIKITREDNPDYADFLLSSDQINAIVVDGGNRKWMGSATSGVYLLSEDGKETIKHFTTENSPLTSNAIIDMAMNQQTGELFIATSNGLFSYITDATEPAEDYTGAYVYPNPVTPDFDGEITVNGLIENSLVRISDVEGNVICEGYSNGGTFTWDGKNLSKKRVATGIYYVFATLEDGSTKMVTKVAFIH